MGEMQNAEKQMFLGGFIFLLGSFYSSLLAGVMIASPLRRAVWQLDDGFNLPHTGTDPGNERIESTDPVGLDHAQDCCVVMSSVRRTAVGAVDVGSIEVLNAPLLTDDRLSAILTIHNSPLGTSLFVSYK